QRVETPVGRSQIYGITIDRGRRPEAVAAAPAAVESPLYIAIARVQRQEPVGRAAVQRIFGGRQLADERAIYLYIPALGAVARVHFIYMPVVAADVHGARTHIGH